MPEGTRVAGTSRNDAGGLYAKLEDRILARDQVGASEVYYDLVRAGRPLGEMVAEAVRIHAPYTHVPYHERVTDGFVNFVNNDHCLLSARATLHLHKMLPGPLAALPMAQTIWYIPTGLDIWNQKILKAPGHYARGFKPPPGPPPAPVVHWPDAGPVALEGSLRDRLDQWLTLVHRGNVMDAYRVFLGLMEDKADRKAVLAELVFAGLIDVQGRELYNRSYTTGHKAYRARATVEIGNALGWENAHDVLYAGALDIAVGPRWYSTYEMACNVITAFIEGEAISAIPYSGTTERERAIAANTEPLSREEGEALIRTLIREPEPAYIEHISRLLLAGKSPRRILDVIQLAAAQVILETQNVNNFSIPQHCYEYCNTLGWFYDNFEHPQRLKLLYVAAAFVNRDASHQKHTGDLQPNPVKAPAEAGRLAPAAILDRLAAGIMALDGAAATAWTQAYLESGADRAPLVRQLALASARIGNDPHNQELPQCLLEDYGKNATWDRERLLLACAHILAMHRKYGDPFESGRRFGAAMGIPELQ